MFGAYGTIKTQPDQKNEWRKPMAVSYKTLSWKAKEQNMTPEQYEKLLNELGKEGWALVAAPNDQHPFLVFEK